MHKGSCLCGVVAFEVSRFTQPVRACHCTQCRKTSGHFWAATRVTHEDFRLTDTSSLRWYDSSPGIRRGFCRLCGSTLFWQPDGRPSISVSAGCFDGPTGLETIEHWYMANKGDYYDIADGVKQMAGE